VIRLVARFSGIAEKTLGEKRKWGVLKNMATRAGKKMFRWDGKNPRPPDLPDSDNYINPPYREGWTL